MTEDKRRNIDRIMGGISKPLRRMREISTLGRDNQEGAKKCICEAERKGRVYGWLH